MIEKNHTKGFSYLREIVSQLRDPVQGCPWDLEQNHSSLIPYLLEEAYEVADAIRHGSNKDLKEELGDLLLQVILHAQIASEENLFSIEDVVQAITAKLIRRHPHVFGNLKLKTSEEVKKKWKEIKIKEKSLPISQCPISDHLREKIRSQPAMKGALNILNTTANEVLEWNTIDGIWLKVNEEIDELKEAINNGDLSNSEKEFGDVIFTLMHVARWYQLDPEEGLARTNNRFLEQFSSLEKSLDGNLSGQPLNKLNQLWQATKKSPQNKQTNQ